MTRGQTTAGGLELLAIGLVTPLLDAVLADRLRVALLPDVGQQAVVVRATRQQLVQHVFDVDPHVEVVPPCAAHQGHHHRALLAAGHATDEEPRLWHPSRVGLDTLLEVLKETGPAAQKTAVNP